MSKSVHPPETLHLSIICHTLKDHNFLVSLKFAIICHTLKDHKFLVSLKFAYCSIRFFTLSTDMELLNCSKIFCLPYMIFSYVG